MKEYFTEAQFVFARWRAESNTPNAEIARKMEIPEVTFYQWKKMYAGMDVAELRRPRQLEAKNRQLKRLVAELTLDKRAPQDIFKKSDVRREAGPGVRHEDILPSLRAAGVSSVVTPPVDDPAQEHGRRQNGASDAAQGSADVTGRVWISTASRPD